MARRPAFKRRKPIVPPHKAFANQEAANRRTLEKLRKAGAIGESLFDLIDREGE